MAGKMKFSRFSSLLSRSKSTSTTPPPEAAGTSTLPTNFDGAAPDSPEGRVMQTTKLFCESGNSNTGDDEVTHLPMIVDAAESSPRAAAAAAAQIRKFLGKEWAKQPYVQYNAIMLIRILSDNPGPSFTRCFDKAFVSTVKELLRYCKDNSTQQILRETLDSLEANKQTQDGMDGLVQMWRKEKGGRAQLNQPGDGMGPPPMGYNMHPLPQQQQQQLPRRHQLPPPQELASRIEEARNTAKILLQLIQSTPSEELLNNDLVREFADRCSGAQKSMQAFISCVSPPPDDDTMLTLIETNEQLSLASTRYQRALLSARRAMSPPAGRNGSGPVPQIPALIPTPQQQQPQDQTHHSAFAETESFAPPPGPPPSSTQHQQQPSENPFADPQPQSFTVDAGPTYPSSPPQQSAYHESAFSPGGDLTMHGGAQGQAGSHRNHVDDAGEANSAYSVSPARERR